jgi:hypothetical protein
MTSHPLTVGIMRSRTSTCQASLRARCSMACSPFDASVMSTLRCRRSIVTISFRSTASSSTTRTSQRSRRSGTDAQRANIVPCSAAGPRYQLRSRPSEIKSPTTRRRRFAMPSKTRLSARQAVYTDALRLWPRARRAEADSGSRSVARASSVRCCLSRRTQCRCESRVAAGAAQASVRRAGFRLRHHSPVTPTHAPSRASRAARGAPLRVTRARGPRPCSLVRRFAPRAAHPHRRQLQYQFAHPRELRVCGSAAPRANTLERRAPRSPSRHDYTHGRHTRRRRRAARACAPRLRTSAALRRHTLACSRARAPRAGASRRPPLRGAAAVPRPPHGRGRFAPRPSCVGARLPPAVRPSPIGALFRGLQGITAIGENKCLTS